jgi:energy-coupling factor transport system permease protein
MQYMPASRMLLLGSLMLLAALILSKKKFAQLVRRTRWIIASLWLIYAFSVPGQALIDASISPTLEGLLQGGMQLMRILSALAGLAILLDRLHREQLIAGLYALLAPLQWAGMSRKRLAVRLALTLQYADALSASLWQESMRGLMEEESAQAMESKTVELPVYRLAYSDALLLASAIIFLWLLKR